MSEGRKLEGAQSAGQALGSLDVTHEGLRALRAAMREGALRGQSAEGSAQAAVDVLFERCRDTVVLARIFLSQPFGRLPDDVQQFVLAQVQKKGVGGLSPVTPVLTLLGTRGEAHDWNDRRRSQGHVGIPLLPGLVRELPMISGLLKALGIDLRDGDSRLVMGAPTAAVFSGMFRVADAKAQTDSAGRKIIPAQDFVARYGIQTVFGIGGLYLSVDSMLAILVFCRQSVDESVVRQLVPFASNFAAITSAMILRGDVFRP